MDRYLRSIAITASLASLVGCQTHSSVSSAGSSTAGSSTLGSATAAYAASSSTTSPPPPSSPAKAGSSVAPAPLPSGPVGGPRAQGADMSEYEGTVTWPQVAAAGLSFGIARVSDGLNYPDPLFAPDWAGMKAQGLCRGVYQYFRASQDPVAQADYVLAQTGTLGPGDLPPFCDVETLDGMTAAQATAALSAWVAEIQLKAGVTPAIYSSQRVWTLFNNPTGFQMDDLWVANWGVSSPALPPLWPAWTFWQYSASGVVPGITGSPGVDVSVFNGTVQDLQAYAGLPVPAGFLRGIAVDSTGQGVWSCAQDGGVFAYGDATFRGTGAGTTYPQPFLGITRTPTGWGYWIFGADGNVLPFGDAVAAGNLAGQTLPAPIVAMAATPTGQGYWLAGQDGTITPFGDATSLGGVSGGTVVGLAATPTGQGYWVATSDGTVLAFGDAVSAGGIAGKLSSPVVAIAGTPSGKGYWLALATGGVQAFGDAPAVTAAGSAGAPVVAIASTLTGQGYWLLASDGTILAAGDAASVGNRPR